jgi:hypothetical protein
MGAMRIRDVVAERLGAVPLPEVSGLAIGLNRDARTTVAAIGDHAATIAWAELGESIEDLEWQTLSLQEAQGTQIPASDPQLEAIAVDADVRILLVQEFPCRAEYIDARSRRVLAHIALEIPDGVGSEVLRESWRDPDGSHAEGVVMLRDRHLLVVKEKDPVALLEFAPVGDAARGFGGDRWLDAGQTWWEGIGADGAQDVTLVLVAAWAPTDVMTTACPDLSDAAAAPNGALVLLSDQGRSIAVVPDGTGSPARDPFDGSFEAISVWRISGLKKPEGIVVLPDLDVLVACDRRKLTKNLFVIRRTEWDRDTQPA